MLFPKKNKRTLFIISYCITILLGCLLISCKCRNSGKTASSPIDDASLFDGDSSDMPTKFNDFSIQVNKTILLGDDTVLPIIFLSTNENIQLEDYILQITLEEPTSNQNNTKSTIYLQGDEDRQTRIRKLLANFPSLGNYHAQSRKLDFCLEPATVCNEINIEIELVNSKTATVLANKRVTWKNLQASFKDIKYNPLTKILTCVVQNSRDIPIEELTLTYENTTKNEVILHLLPNQALTFKLEKQAYKELQFQLELKEVDLAEFKFELTYRNSSLATQAILVKNIQIALEGLNSQHTFGGNELVKCFIKNLSAHPIETSDLAISLTYPSHTTFALLNASGNDIQPISSGLTLNNLTSKNILASGEAASITLGLVKATSQFDATVSLEIGSVDRLYTEPYIKQHLSWRADATDSTKNRVDSAGINSPTTLTEEPGTTNTPNLAETGTLAKRTLPTAQQAKVSDNNQPDYQKETNTNKQTRNSLDFSNEPMSFTDDTSTNTKNNLLPTQLKVFTDVATVDLNKQKQHIQNVIDLARELCYIDMNDRVTLISHIAGLWETLPTIDAYVFSMPEAVSNAYEEVLKGYTTLDIYLMDTELDHLLPDLASKVKNIISRIDKAAKIIDSATAYTRLSRCYSYATMTYMACCKDKESSMYADQALELANLAQAACYKSSSMESYMHAAKAYCYAITAYQKIFTTYLGSDVNKCKLFIEQAQYAARMAHYTANISEDKEIYTEAVRASEEVKEMDRMLSIATRKE